MASKEKNKITIIGSGLAGSFLAVLLAQKGYRIEIYERLSRDDICDTASKRSYNIVLFGHGIHLLKQANLWNDIKPYLLTLQGTVTHIGKKAKPIISFVDHKKMPYFTISRARLLDILLKKASANSSVTIHYNTVLLSIDRYNKTITVQNTKTKKIETVSCEVVIGADGANSLVRSFIQQGQQTNHLQEYATWVYKQFVLTPKIVEELKLRKNFVHVWTQKEAFIIMHPDSNNSLGAMLVYPKNNKNSDLLHSSAGIKKFFAKNFFELLPALNEITSSILTNPDGNFATIYTTPWYYKGFMTIIGDAAHGFYPFFGQGTTAAFTDCMTLIKLIETQKENWEEIFSLYQQNRKEHTDTLGDLSKEVIRKYLRYKKADFEAIYDKLESELHRLFPKLIYPPLSQSVVMDPSNAADYRKKYFKQRKIAHLVGISLIITAGTGLLAVYETMKKT